MRYSVPRINKGLIITLIVILSCLAIIRIVNGVQGGLSDSGGWDYHPFWYHGQSLRIGSEWAYEQAGSTAATYTPPLNFVISSLSYLDFNIAKPIWLSFLLMVVLVIPWILFSAVSIKMSRTCQVIIALSFYGLTGISIAIRAGQPSIFVVFLMVVSLWLYQKDRNILSGIFLGLALSKFSLALPLFLYYVYKRKWIMVIIGVAIQVMGFLGLSVMTGSSLLEIISNYQNQIKVLAGASHINLLHIAGHFPHSYTQYTQLGMLLSIEIFGLVWLYVIRNRPQGPTEKHWDFGLLAFLNSWALLVCYVQQYDIGISIFASSFLICAIDQSSQWNLSNRQKKILICFSAISLF